MARLNGIQWGPSNEQIVNFCKMLVADCEEFEAPDGPMKDAGWKVYQYIKNMEKEDADSASKSVKVKAEAKVNNAAEYNEC